MWFGLARETQKGEGMGVSIQEASGYFGTRLGAGAAWSACVEQAAALATAERMLAANFTLDGLEQSVLVEAVCEQALFLLLNPGSEKRAAFQAQGVVSSGLVQESYGPGAGGVPVAPMAAAVLSGRELFGAGRSGHLHRRHH